MFLTQPHSRAMLMALGAFFSFSVLNACVKYLGMAGYSAFQVAFMNALISLACLLGWQTWRWRGQGGLARWLGLTSFPPLWLLAYLALALVACLCLFTAFGQGSFPVITAIVASSPLCVALFSAACLRERLSRRQVLLIMLGFCGVLLIARPQDMAIDAAVWLALVGTFAYAGTQTLVRSRHGRIDIVLLTCFFFACVAAVMPFLMQPVSLSAGDLGYVLIGGLADAAGLVLLYGALMRAPAATVAPFEYSCVIWAGILGYFIWGEWPDTVSLAGILLIVGAGIAFVRTGRQTA